MPPGRVAALIHLGRGLGIHGVQMLRNEVPESLKDLFRGAVGVEEGGSDIGVEPKVGAVEAEALGKAAARENSANELRGELGFGGHRCGDVHEMMNERMGPKPRDHLSSSSVSQDDSGTAQCLKLPFHDGHVPVEPWLHLHTAAATWKIWRRDVDATGFQANSDLIPATAVVEGPVDEEDRHGGHVGWFSQL